MPAITTIINTPVLFLRVFLNVATVASGVGVVAAGVSVGVVVAKLVMNPPPDSSDITDPIVKTTIILESPSSLAFNRLIHAYEYDGYYNATATLLYLAEELNIYLKQEFPDSFIKALVSEFSSKPEVNPSSRKKRLDYYKSRTRRRRTMRILYRSKRDDSTPSTTLPFEISYTSSPEETTQTYLQDQTFWTDSPDLQMSTNFGGSDSYTEGTTASTSPITRDLDSTVQATTVQDSNAGNCNTSTISGTSNTSVIVVTCTLYFNTTSNNLIDPNKIIHSLQSFNPIITLADKCLNPSPAPSAFNPTLSTIKPPSVVQGGTAFLGTAPTIPLSLLNQTNSIISPIQAAQANLTTPIPPTTTPTTPTTTTAFTGSITASTESTTTTTTAPTVSITASTESTTTTTTAASTESMTASTESTTTTTTAAASTESMTASTESTTSTEPTTAFNLG